MTDVSESMVETASRRALRTEGANSHQDYIQAVFKYVKEKVDDIGRDGAQQVISTASDVKRTVQDVEEDLRLPTDARRLRVPSRNRLALRLVTQSYRRV
jgi:hypothetical protein